MAIVTITALRCDRCGHEWVPRGGVNAKSLPRWCSNKSCHSPYWNAGPPTRPTVSEAKRRRAKY